MLGNEDDIIINVDDSKGRQEINESFSNSRKPEKGKGD